VPLDKINSTLVKLSIKQAFRNPFQYIILGLAEGLKMFFWESTKIGFVSYPHWLQKIYDIKIFNNALRLIVSLLSLIAVAHLWLKVLSSRASPIEFLMGVLIFVYILSFSFVCVLTRYALPFAPIYLITIGVWINEILDSKNKFEI
jgi:hypothetical protein